MMQQDKKKKNQKKVGRKNIKNQKNNLYNIKEI